MTTDQLALLEAILAHPEEDTPRLMYADWLDEQDKVPCAECDGRGFLYHGGTQGMACSVCSGTGRVAIDPGRAELIRVQVELTNYNSAIVGMVDSMPETWDWQAPEYARLKYLRAHESALLTQHGERWRKGPVCGRCSGKGETRRDKSSGKRSSVATCPDCHGTGDAGGLMRKFDYDWESSHGAGTITELVREEYERGWRKRLIVPQLVDCVGIVYGTGTVEVPPEYAPSPWLRTVLTATPERGLIREVVPIDSEPHHVYYPASAHTGGTDFYRWWCYQNEDEVLPEHRMALLPKLLYEPLRALMPFPTRDLAIAALGWALAAFGRKT